MAKNKLLSGRVKVTPAANVAADRYNYLGLDQAEPNLGFANADGYVLTYSTTAPGNRLWQSSSLLSGGLVAQSAFATANNAEALSTSAYIHANAAFDKANTVGLHANGAFAAANSKFSSSGGTITGDTNITGNLTVVGTTTYANTQTVLIADNILTLNAAIDQSAQPAVNAGIEIDRGAQPNAQFIWVESSGKWSANNGNGSIFIAAESAESYANGAFAAANVADQRAVTSGTYANAAFGIANSASSYANGAFAAANTADQRAVTSGAYANAAFGVANSASSYANGAFVAANTADQRAVTSGVYANAAFGVANSASSYANGAFASSNTRLSTSGGTISGDLVVTGNLSVEGTTVTVNVTTLAIEDSLIQLGRNNTGDSIDIGFLGHYNNGSANIHTGLFRRAADDTYYLFENWNGEPAGQTIDTSNPTFKIATLSANLTANSVIIRGLDPLTQANAAFGVANSASSYANGAFASANTADQRAVTSGAYANAAFGVANSASSYANGAFVAANTADQKAVSAGSYANGAFAQANSNFTSAVTRLSVTNSGASAYLIDQYTGNNPTIYVSAGETIAFLLNNVTGHPFMIRVSSGGSNYDTGLTHVDTSGIVLTGSSAQGQINGTLYWKVPFDLVGSTYVYQCSAHSGMVGNIVIQQPVSFVASNTASAFAAANTADQKAVSAGSYANGAFAAANTADQKAVSAGVYANAAFAVANSAAGSSTDTFARTQANAAFNAANSATGTVGTLAYAHANAAFDAANSGGSQIYVASLQNFTSNGQNTTFTLSTTPTSANQLFVYVDGIYQQASAYTLSNNIITLSEALDANAVLEVRVFANTTTAHLNNQVDTFTGTGACTTFTLTSAPRDKNLTTIIVGGVPQLKSAYNISGSSLVFSGAPANGASIEVSTYSGGGSYATSFTSVVDTFAGDNSTTTFTLSTLPQSENQTFAFVNGVYQQKNTYSLSGANIVFTGTATTNDTIEVVTVAGSEMNVTSARYNTRTYTANGVQTTFTISSGHTANSILVFENGICQEPIADYTVSGTTLTFLGGAPVVNTRIQIRELPV